MTCENIKQMILFKNETMMKYYDSFQHNLLIFLLRNNLES